MKNLWIAIGLILSNPVFANENFFSKNIYKAQDFEVGCGVDQGINPIGNRFPFCPLIYQFKFPADATLDLIKENTEKLISNELFENNFVSAETAFIIDMKARQDKVTSQDFTKKYDQLFKNIYSSAKTNQVWVTSEIGYLVIVSLSNHSLYIIQSGAAQK